MKFFEILRELIDERNITQKQLAKDLHMPTSTLGGYVQGTSEPDFETLKIFATYFQTSTDYLLGMHTTSRRSYKEDDLLRVYRCMSDEQQDIYLEQGKAFLKINNIKPLD